MVDNISFASRSSTFHHLTSATYMECHNVPFAFAECSKTHLACRLVGGEGEVYHFPITTLGQLIGHDLVKTSELLLLGIRACHVESLPFLGHIHIVLLEYSLCCSIVDRHQRASKRPSRACRHIGFDASGGSGSLDMSKHLHPFWRKVRDVILVIALHPVNGSNLHTPDTSTCILIEVVTYVCGIDSTSQPPPTRVWFGFRTCLYPVLR